MPLRWAAQAVLAGGSPRDLLGALSEVVAAVSARGQRWYSVNEEDFFLPSFEYLLDESDPDLLVLRRQDGTFVAAFSARGATKEGIVEAAEQDYGALLRENAVPSGPVARGEPKAPDQLTRLNHRSAWKGSSQKFIIGDASLRLAVSEGSEAIALACLGLLLVESEKSACALAGFCKDSSGELSCVKETGAQS
jgi:hypothetical protein